MKFLPEEKRILRQASEEINRVEEVLLRLEKEIGSISTTKQHIATQKEKTILLVIESGKTINIEEYKQRERLKISQEIDKLQKKLNSLDKQYHPYSAKFRLLSIVSILIFILFWAAFGSTPSLNQQIIKAFFLILSIIAGVLEVNRLLSINEYPVRVNILRQRINLLRSEMVALDDDIEEIIRAKKILQEKAFIEMLCPRLKNISNDAMEIAKVIIPILLTASIIQQTLILIPSPVFIAAIILLITRIGISALCSA